MFGDSITDLGAMVQGRNGHCGRPEISSEGCVDVPSRSAPRLRNIRQERHQSMRRSAPAGMLCETIGEEAAGQAIEQAVIKALSSGKDQESRSGKMGMGTTEVGTILQAWSSRGKIKI